MKDKYMTVGDLQATLAALPPETLVAVEGWRGRFFSNITPWSFQVDPSDSRTDLLDYDLREKIVGKVVLVLEADRP